MAVPSAAVLPTIILLCCACCCISACFAASKRRTGSGSGGSGRYDEYDRVFDPPPPSVPSYQNSSMPPRTGEWSWLGPLVGGAIAGSMIDNAFRSATHGWGWGGGGNGGNGGFMGGYDIPGDGG